MDSYSALGIMSHVVSQILTSESLLLVTKAAGENSLIFRSPYEFDRLVPRKSSCDL